MTMIGKSIHRHRCVERHLLALLALAFAWGPATTSIRSQTADRSMDVAALTAQLQGDDLQARREAAWSLAEVDWELHADEASAAVAALKESVSARDPQIANGSLQALGRMKSRAREALDAIWNEVHSGDDQRRYRASFALGHVIDPRDEQIGESLRHSSAQVREATARAIGYLPEGGESWAAELVQLLADDSEKVVTAARESLRALGDSAIEVLTESLGRPSSSSVLLERVAGTLEQIGPPAVAATDHLLALSTNSTPAVRAAALDAIGAVSTGTQAAGDAIRRGLMDQEPPVRQAAIRAAIRMPTEASQRLLPELITCLSGDAETANLAAFAVGRMGAVALPEIERMVAGITPDNQTAVLDALSRLGVDAIGPLLRLVRGNELSFDQAARIIQAMGMPSVAKIQPSLASAEPSERAVAALVIGNLQVMPQTLLPLLTDSDSIVRVAALEGIRAAGSGTAESLAAIVQCATDPEAEVRRAALAALAKLHADSDRMLTATLRGLQDVQASVRRQAAANLVEVDEIPGHAMDALQAALKDADPSVRLAAAEAIGKSGEAARPAIPALTAAARDTDSAVAAMVATALGQFATPETIAALTTLTRHPDPTVQQSAIAAVAACGTSASSIQPRLEELAISPVPETRIAAALALSQVLSDEQARLEPLVNALNDDEWTVRRKATEAIGGMGVNAKRAVPRLLDQLREYGDDAESVMDALRQIDDAPPEAIPALMRLLEEEDTDRRHRFFALHLLRKLGPAARDALPVLRQMREKADGRLADFLDRAIRDIEPQ